MENARVDVLLKGRRKTRPRASEGVVRWVAGLIVVQEKSIETCKSSHHLRALFSFTIEMRGTKFCRGFSIICASLNKA